MKKISSLDNLKKVIIALIVIVLLLIGLLCVRFILGGDEDNWIKDSETGTWVKHGNPEIMPDYVLEDYVESGGCGR